VWVEFRLSDFATNLQVHSVLFYTAWKMRLSVVVYVYLASPPDPLFL